MGAVFFALPIAIHCAETAGTPAAPRRDPYEASLALAREVMARHPGQAKLVKILADIHFRRGKFREAISVYQQALGLDPKLPEPLFAIGSAHFQLEEFDQAIAAYARVIEGGEPGLVVQARIRTAEVCFRLSRFADAAREARTAIESRLASPEAFHLLGKALDSLSRTGASGNAEAAKLEEEAAAALQTAVTLDPRNGQAHYLLATIHRRQGKADLARQDLENFRRSAVDKPEMQASEYERAERLFEANTALHLARTVFGLGEKEEALSLLERSLQAEPGFPDTLALQGLVRMSLGRLEEAIASYQEALARDPNHAESLWNLGKAHLKAGRLDAAAPLLLKAVEIRRSFAEGWELLAQLAEVNGIYPERAEEFARNALRLRPTSGNYSRFAKLLFSSGRAEEARKVLLEGIRRYPDDPDLRTGLAVLDKGAPGR